MLKQLRSPTVSLVIRVLACAACAMFGFALTLAVASHAIAADPAVKAGAKDGKLADSVKAGAPSKELPSTALHAKAGASMKPVAPEDLKALRSLDAHYKKVSSASMKVEKTLILGLLGQERKSTGQAWMSQGRLRMELGGSDKTLLVVNKSSLWAVTYPPEEFKDAALQVIKGDLKSKKARSQGVLGLLTQGGILKVFKPTGIQVLASGDLTYFLQPEKSQTDFTRAQLKVSGDHKKILSLRYWDERDNETNFEFSDIAFGKKVDDKLFTFDPPANADVMTL